jgi:hypothetical protein
MKSRMPDDYQIPDDPDTGRMDAAYLRTCLGLRAKLGEEPPQLPLAVRRVHYDMARSLSILGATGPSGMDPTQLAMVVVLALREDSLQLPPEPEVPEYSFMPEVDAGRVKEGQKVVVHWRKKDHVAHFLRVEKDRLTLLHEGHERRFRPDLVRYPKEGEFPEAVENINATSLA